MDAAGARHVGAGLLAEVEEESLEELLRSLRTTNAPSHHTSSIPFADLSALTTRYHQATQSAPYPLFSVTGRYLPLLYHLISTLIAPPHNFTVVVIDAETKFDVTHLVRPNTASHPATVNDLHHVYVYRPPRGQDHIKAAIAAAEEFMLYGAHGSRHRQWWGTVVIGGVGGGQVNAGWRGWLRVDRENVEGFGIGMSVEEALVERVKRQQTVEAAGWVASSRWGKLVAASANCIRAWYSRTPFAKSNLTMTMTHAHEIKALGERAEIALNTFQAIFRSLFVNNDMLIKTPESLVLDTFHNWLPHTVPSIPYVRQDMSLEECPVLLTQLSSEVTNVTSSNAKTYLLCAMSGERLMMATIRYCGSFADKVTARDYTDRSPRSAVLQNSLKGILKPRFPVTVV
ncbi:hypothetical protein GGS21DRAFT_487784 [Xylaria nigripes]|nr:hypothetical protein GGS21DRAFT_487784 [Xylaria nigripes]